MFNFTISHCSDDLRSRWELTVKKSPQYLEKVIWNWFLIKGLIVGGLIDPSYKWGFLEVWYEYFFIKGS